MLTHGQLYGSCLVVPHLIMVPDSRFQLSLLVLSATIDHRHQDCDLLYTHNTLLLALV